MEPVVLLKAINLTQDKIWSLLEKLRSPEIGFTIQRVMSTLDEDGQCSISKEVTAFKQWVANLPILVSLQPGIPSSELMPHVKWASEAKWVYSEPLEAMLGSEEGELPPWLKHIYKIGRYYAATKAMLKLATKQPNLFSGIEVEVVKAPE
jgi:hypothetical protein